MSFRVTNTYMNNQELSDIGLQQQRLAIAQQQVGNGLRINSPSDDPYGDAAVININTQTAVMNQFAQNATTVNNSLSVADGALNTYQQTLDTASSLLTEGQSTITTQSAKNAIATQLQGMAQTIISIANTQNEGEYVFGGTRQSVPPFDPATQALSALPTAPQLVQVQPGSAPIASGVTADSVFSNAGGTILATISSAITALQGTGNAAADQATLATAAQQLNAFSDQANISRTVIGSNMDAAQAASSLTSGTSTMLQNQASNIKSADFATASVNLTTAQTSLQALLDSVVTTDGKSLFDLLAGA